MKRGDHRPTLILMLKEPRPGQVKTRLGRDVGMTVAAQWFRIQTRALIRAVTRDPRWHTILCIAPDGSLRSPTFPPNLNRWPQGRGSLGDRMKRALWRAMPGPAILIGGDIPGIGTHHIARAFQALKSHQAVLGPAPDGGYWLIGFRGPQIPHGVFTDVRWSTSDALDDTRASLGTTRTTLIDMLADVDVADDLAPSDIRATPLRIRD
ncbi:MAG: TIGR04282 family arsenosugar biosynthesis glycosyltransferase [Pseudomonadota bacterium]